MSHYSTHDGTRRFTVTEAASVLGISTEATRQRVKRGTLPTIRDEEGNVFVLLEHDGTRKDGNSTSDGTHDSTALVERMAGEIEYLRDTIACRDEEIRRRDHLLAAALERIPALEEPSGPRESPVTVMEATGKSTAPREQEEPSQRRLWWRAFFGLG
jgi:hypothetical protein